MLKAYRYRLFPNEEQRVLIEKHFGCSRFIYNYALNQKIEFYEKENKSLSQYEIMKMLPILKKQDETCWLKEVNSQSLQHAIMHVDQAYVRFFREKKGFPKFKSKHEGTQSYTIPPNTSVKIDFKHKKIQVPKMKNLRFDAHRTFVGEIRTSTISRTSTGKYYISILVEDGTELPSKKDMTEETTVGIDLGITHFLTTSRGEKIDNPRYLHNKQNALKRSQRNLSRKKKGSNNYKKEKNKLARKHERVTNERKDFHHKVSTSLVRDNQTNTIVMETLDIRSMTNKSQRKKKWSSGKQCLSRQGAMSVNDVGWGKFISMIKYKCDWYGKNFIQIGQYEPSSKLCSSCGKINKSLKLSDREWTCSNCNTTHDRDINASCNIKHIGMGQPEFKPLEQEYILVMNEETTRSLA